MRVSVRNGKIIIDGEGATLLLPADRVRIDYDAFGGFEVEVINFNYNTTMHEDFEILKTLLKEKTG